MIAASLSYIALFGYLPGMIALRDDSEGDTGLHKVTGGNTSPLDRVNGVNFGRANRTKRSLSHSG